MSRLYRARLQPCRNVCRINSASQAAKKVQFVIPSEARDLLFFSGSKKQQIPRANPALRNDMAGVFPQPVQPLASPKSSFHTNSVEPVWDLKFDAFL